MDEFIKNILNQPEKIEEGQIWTSVDAGRDYLITKVLDEDKGIFRAVVITKLLYLNDGNDVVISKDENKFLAVDKLTLRITDGPLHKRQIDLFLGKVPEQTLQQILNSLKNREFIYDDDQDFIISEILDELHEEHIEAVNYYEETLDEAEYVANEKSHDAIIIDISAYLNKDKISKVTTINEENVGYYSFAKNKLAADDISNKETELLFWQEIGKMPSENIYKTDKIEIYLSFDLKRNNMLLIAYAKEDINIDEIKLELGNEIINAKSVFSGTEPGIQILTSVYTFDVDLKSLKSKEAKLILLINNINWQRKILFK